MRIACINYKAKTEGGLVLVGGHAAWMPLCLLNSLRLVNFELALFFLPFFSTCRLLFGQQAHHCLSFPDH